jgi:hypothetical protein
MQLLLQLKERCKDGWMEYEQPFSYWHGFPGIYQFLHRVNQLQFLDNLAEKLNVQLFNLGKIWYD